MDLFVSYVASFVIIVDMRIVELVDEVIIVLMFVCVTCM